MILKSGMPECLLSEGAGDKWQAPIECDSWGQEWSSLNFYKYTLRLKEKASV